MRTNAYLDAISSVGRRGFNYDPEHWVKFSTRRLIAAACMAIADAENAGIMARMNALCDEWGYTAESSQLRDALESAS